MRVCSSWANLVWRSVVPTPVMALLVTGSTHRESVTQVGTKIQSIACILLSFSSFLRFSVSQIPVSDSTQIESVTQSFASNSIHLCASNISISFSSFLRFPDSCQQLNPPTPKLQHFNFFLKLCPFLCFSRTLLSSAPNSNHLRACNICNILFRSQVFSVSQILCLNPQRECYSVQHQTPITCRHATFYFFLKIQCNILFLLKFSPFLYFPDSCQQLNPPTECYSVQHFDFFLKFFPFLCLSDSLSQPTECHSV